MITVVAMPTGGDASAVTVVLLLMDDSSTGIRRITVRDRSGGEVPFSQPEGCPTPSWESAPQTVARTILPLTVEAIDCAGATTPPDVNGPLLSGEAALPPIDGPTRCVPTDCPPPTRACTDAAGAATTARSALARRCGSCDALEHAADAKLAEAIAWTILSFVVAIIAAAVSQVPIWGAVAGAIFAILAVAFGAAANAAYKEEARLRSQAVTCRREVEALRSRFLEAAAVVTTNCCPGCSGVPLNAPC